MSETKRAVSVQRVIDAPPDRIFDVLADPAKHAVIDGSGTVQQSRDHNPVRLQLGSKFGMSMRWGMPYRIKNTVVEYEENVRIAWRHFGGHRWRFELEPAGEGTRVTETFDYSTAIVPKAIEMAGYPRRHPAWMQKTLERLDDHVTSESGD